MPCKSIIDKSNYFMSEKRIKIQNINIKIGDKTLSLSPDDARELKDILNNLLGGEKVVEKEVVKWYPYSYPQWYVTSPNIWKPDYQPSWTVTCSSAGTVNLGNCLSWGQNSNIS